MRGRQTHNSVFLPLAFNLFFGCVESARKVLVLCGGKRNETGWKARFYRDSVAVFHDYSATLPIARRLRSNRR